MKRVRLSRAWSAFASLSCWFIQTLPLSAAAPPSPGDAALAAYFRAETDQLASQCLNEVSSRQAWVARQEDYRRQLFEMLGLAPLPERTDLQPVVTKRTERDEFVVENLHFQSLPGLYVTANLYRPRTQTNRAPAVLYLSGHGAVKKDGVSYGNKVHYQHHGIWFARHGYACLILDTIQLGEIEGMHHGTYREGLWWWNARGYTPAGVEAWNCIRALDYLQTRAEVDPARIGVTGRSGGGAYSWWVAALDDRVKVAAPVAGITDLRNHVVDGTVEGHCDCMFFVNTCRWDYPLVAALVAPRPLLIVNTDTDQIFPLDGVLRVHDKVRRIYQLHDAAEKLGLVIGPGPHKDTQDLQIPVFRWFNRHLKGEDPVIAVPAVPSLEPHDLRVFDTLPTDERTTRIHESFVPRPTPVLAADAADWARQREAWLSVLREKCFAGWPETPGLPSLQPVTSAERSGLQLTIHEFDSQPHVRLRVYFLRATRMLQPTRLILTALEDTGRPAPPAMTKTGNQAASVNTPAPAPQDAHPDGPARGEQCPSYAAWLAVMRAGFPADLSAELAALGEELAPDPVGWEGLRSYLHSNQVALAFLAPRGVGLTAWNKNPKQEIQIRRRFMLLGQTLAGMRVWDIRRAAAAIRGLNPDGQVALWLQGRGDMACHALYAALFEPGLGGLELWELPTSHVTGPDYLNVLRFLDVPQAVTMAAERFSVRLHQTSEAAWRFPRETARKLGWNQDRLLFVPLD